MDAASQEADLLRVADKLSGHLGRGILTPREVVNKLTEELAYHGRADLAATVLPRLPAEVARELGAWVAEVLRPGYRYRPFFIGEWPSEEHREEYIRRMQPELVALAGRLQTLLGA